MNKESRILVVDDEPTITDGLRLLLGSEGYKVETASNLNTGINAVKRHNFDLVLTDLHLPDDDHGGLSLLRNVKEVSPETK
ncbi:MAG: response regulator [Acidobacteria bacterium]|nr:response regulator [Acidobacteriota bacterium]